MQDLKTLTIPDFHKTLLKSNKIVIIPHKNPDGDAIGSSLGLFHYLQEIGKDCTVVINDAVPEFLRFLPDTDKILILEEDPESCTKIVAEAEIIFCLDYAQLHRSGGLESHINASKAVKAVVDHHPGPDTNFDFYFHEIASSSTCELIYQLIREMDSSYTFSKQVAVCLYTGLVTDTGCFKHALRPETFIVASELLKTGISYEMIITNIYDVNTPERLKLLGFALNERLVVLPEYRTAYISLSYEDGEKMGVKKGDTEGLVNYALSMQNMAVGVFFHEREKGKTKISFRSKGNFAVNELSGKFFGGGGHKNAAGGEFAGDPNAAIARFIEILPQYKSELASLEIGKRD
jgi:phosphoesterase RecJ-like protein